MSAWNYFFTILFCSVLVWAGAGSCNQLSTGPTMKFLSHLRTSVGFSSRSMRPVGCYNSLGSQFFFPLGNVICISQSRSKEKEGCYDPIWDGQCFTAFFSDGYLTDHRPHANLWYKTNSPSFPCRPNAGLFLSLSGRLALTAKSKTMQMECIRSNGS